MKPVGQINKVGLWFFLTYLLVEPVNCLPAEFHTRSPDI